MWHKWGNRLVFNVIRISNFLLLKKVFSHGLVPPLILRPGSGPYAMDPLSVKALLNKEAESYRISCINRP